MNKREFDAFWNSCLTNGKLDLEKVKQKPEAERTKVALFIARAQRGPILMELVTTQFDKECNTAAMGYWHISRNKAGFQFLHTGERPPTDPIEKVPTLVVKIRMRTDAFTDERGGKDAEVARILRSLADRIDGHPHFSPGHDQALMDVDGVEAGFAQVQELEILPKL